MLKNMFSQIQYAFNLILELSHFLFILFLIIILFYGCKNDNSVMPISEGDINVTLKNYETYEYPTVGGDEEGAIIKTQARHFETSEIKRNSSTNYVAVYIYKPKLNYVGTDFVEIEIRKGSDGASPPTEIKTIKINFIVTK